MLHVSRSVRSLRLDILVSIRVNHVSGPVRACYVHLRSSVRNSFVSSVTRTCHLLSCFRLAFSCIIYVSLFTLLILRLTLFSVIR